MLEAAAELGARFVNAICEDPDLSRLSDEFGRLAEEARPYAVRPVIEFMAYRTVRTLDDAVAIAAGSDGGVLIDALHVQRCGVGLDALRAVDPGLVSYIQLCDAPLAAPGGEGAEITEARDGGCCPAMASSRFCGLLAALPRASRWPWRRLRRAPARARRNSPSGRGVPCRRFCPGQSSPGKGAAIVTAPPRGRDLKKHYGGVQALRGVSLDMRPARCSASSATTAPANPPSEGPLRRDVRVLGEVLLDGQPAGFATRPPRGCRGRDRLPGPGPGRSVTWWRTSSSAGRSWPGLAGPGGPAGWTGKAMAAHTVSDAGQAATRIPDVRPRFP